MNHRIVVTGEGVVTPLGVGSTAFANAVWSGTSSVAPTTRFQNCWTSELLNFDPSLWLGSRGIRSLDRGTRFLSVSAHLALEALALARSDDVTVDPELGLVCGTMFGSLHSMVSFDWTAVSEGPAYVSPMEFANTVLNAPAGHSAIKHRLRGVSATISAGYASSLYAFQYAMDFLQLGRSQHILAGGMEEVCDETVLGLTKLGLATSSGFVHPFSSTGDGTAQGEGAALWLLSTEEAALEAKLQPVLEVCGFGAAQSPNGILRTEARATLAARAIHQALHCSGINPDQVACVIGSANGYFPQDELEAEALRLVFGTRLRTIPICAPKAALGETMGASGTFSAIIAGMALERRELPPTATFQNSDLGLSLSSSSQPVDGDYALINSFGCDGNYCALVIRRWSH